MRVEKIDWISKSAKEAELIVSDGNQKCLVFSQPCNLVLGNKLEEPLHAVDVQELMKIADHSTPEKIASNKEDSYYSHHCVARVIDLDDALVAVGEIRVELDCPIPSWAEENDMIEFDCARLDFW